MVARYNATSVEANVPIPAAKMLLSVERVSLLPVVFVPLWPRIVLVLLWLFLVFRDDD